MLEFETLEELNPNTKLIEILKNYTYTIKNGIIKHLLHINLKFIEPTTYIITHHTTLTILEYKVNKIVNKSFYIQEKNEKYNLTEINLKDFLFHH